MCNRPTHTVIARLLSGIGLMMGVTFAGHAQLQLEEIVVTAQKRAQNLQDVPISVLAVSGEEISRQGFKRLEEVTTLMPNVTVTEAALGDQLFIRGIGSGLNIGFEQSVGTFVDGVYLGRGLQSRNIFLDIERIEVLRGPQSTFFGNNAIAGAMSITTRGPSETWDGYVSGMLRRWDRYDKPGSGRGRSDQRYGRYSNSRSLFRPGWLANQQHD